MYASVRDVPQAGAPTARTRTRVGGTVLALGTVSLLTDVSSEMVAAVLPVYLTLTLGLSPLAFGVVDGIYQGTSVLVRLGAAAAADRWSRPKTTAALGYGLSALCKLGLLAASGAAALSAVLAVDRTGKGLRTAPRDALIAAAAPAGALGRAFGVHRAMDTTGALLGPLLAVGLLLYLPGDYDSLFLVSAVFAVLGLAVLVTFVPERRRATGRPPVRWRQVAALLGHRPVRRVALTGAVLGLLTVTDGFLYLLVREREAVSAALFPLLFVGTAAVYLVLAVPLGRLTDRVGRVPVIVAGHVALLAAYAALLLLPGGGPLLAGLVVATLGVYYAATDGVLAALAAELSPEDVRTSGIALVQTAVAAGRSVSALLFGLLWTLTGQWTALAGFAVALVVVLPAALRALRGIQGGPRA
ncbi:sugar phosphate permease [Geodermatophilus normandii]|uniref:Sugar phosphate permease n=1 Tax=Geodermatophilus normandii TaxID=1137989 RepID=A0A317QET7_9ACTN|nr:MFS transporter [Geodermatophilus normandii]PWW21391.1 sugar phosphate permease [Geodermatophilus normandii]